MKKTGKTSRIIIYVLLIAILFSAASAVSASITRRSVAKKAAEAEAAEESGTEEAAEEDGNAEAPDVDRYSMQGYCHDNAVKVFEALQSGDGSNLEALMTDPSNVDAVMEFADWKDAFFEDAVSMGSGSLTSGPAEDGRIDESERFFVDAEGTTYVLFIETLTSDYGRVNEGVTAVGVTTFNHFDAIGFSWNGEPDEQSVLAGALFWAE